MLLTTAAVRAGPGTRPGLHGQTLLSTGLGGLDSLLGGGLALGSLVLVLEARIPLNRSFPPCFLVASIVWLQTWCFEPGNALPAKLIDVEAPPAIADAPAVVTPPRLICCPSPPSISRTKLSILFS